MANEKLRAALRAAGLQADELAEIVEVDVRSVRRWLSGQNPRPRQRAKVARALDTTEQQLWPEAASRPGPNKKSSDPLGGYPTASDLDAPDWKGLMREATERVELLGETLAPVLATTGVPELLATKAVNRCGVRILVSRPGRHLAVLLDHPQIAIRVLETPAQYAIYRFDEELLLTLSLVGLDSAQAPLLQVRRAAPGGLFDRLADHYDGLWTRHSQPIYVGLDLDNDQDEGTAARSASEQHRSASPRSPASRPQPSSPRRWPRQPS